MPVRRKGLDPRDYNFLVIAPRSWGEAETLDQAIENARANLPDTDKDKVEATVYLISEETDASIESMTGAVALDSSRLQSYPVPDEEMETKMIDEGNGIEHDPETGEKLEYVSNIEIRTEQPTPEH